MPRQPCGIQEYFYPRAKIVDAVKEPDQLLQPALGGRGFNGWPVFGPAFSWNHPMHQGQFPFFLKGAYWPKSDISEPDKGHRP